jgi:hypothetical protein
LIAIYACRFAIGNPARRAPVASTVRNGSRDQYWPCVAYFAQVPAVVDRTL